jgi:hypothetical protein
VAPEDRTDLEISHRRDNIFPFNSVVFWGWRLLFLGDFLCFFLEGDSDLTCTNSHSLLLIELGGERKKNYFFFAVIMSASIPQLPLQCP